MPGFMINKSGSLTGNHPGSKIEPKRAYRWALEFAGTLGQIVTTYLKSASRPELSFGAIEMKHNQETIYHIGQTKWNSPIPIVFYDMEQNPNVSKEVYDWINETTYNVPNANPMRADQYKQIVHIFMLDNLGDTIEGWYLYNAWGSKNGFGELSYEQETIPEVRIDLHYDRAERADKI